MGFNCLKTTESLWRDSLLFTTKFPGLPGAHLISLWRRKSWVDSGATQWFWTWDPWIENPAFKPLGHWLSSFDNTASNVPSSLVSWTFIQKLRQEHSTDPFGYSILNEMVWYTPHTLLSHYSNKKTASCPWISNCTPSTLVTDIWVYFSSHLKSVDHITSVLTWPLSHISPNILKPPLNHTCHLS